MAALPGRTPGSSYARYTVLTVKRDATRQMQQNEEGGKDGEGEELKMMKETNG